MPKPAELKGHIELRRARAGWRWVIFVWTASISCAEVVSETVFKTEGRALRQANVWARRLKIEIK